MGDLPRMARRVASSWIGAPHSSLSSESTVTSSSSCAPSTKFSGTAVKHVCATRRVAPVPMKLVNKSPTTLLRSIEIRGLQPTSCHGSQAGSSKRPSRLGLLPLETRCFAENGKSLRHRARRNTRIGCMWHRKISRELCNRCPRHRCCK